MTNSELLKSLDQLKIQLATWRGVAKVLGTTTQSLQNWRSGRYEPRARHLRKLEEVMNGK